MSKLRWKKEPKPTGLQAVGAGPLSSKLHDGIKEYATVYALGGSWMSPLSGWYWVCPTDSVGIYMNTCGTPAPDEKTAKAQAFEFVKKHLNQEKCK